MAATTTSTTTTSTPSELAQQILTHSAPSYTFTFSPFLRQTYGHGLEPNRPVCKDFSEKGSCPRGASCPDRHVPGSQAQPANASFNSLVCKHWLRALCKKGEHCEFLHEYNLRKMPECNFFVRNGYCSNGDECLYLHIDPQSKLPPCPWYERGFCPLGLECAKKHVRRKLCPFYLAGFCPDGKECKEGAHARWEKDAALPEPVRKSDVVREEPAVPKKEDGFGGGGAGSGGAAGGFGGGDEDGKEHFGGGQFDRNQRGGGRGDRFGGGGGRGGRWRGKGDRKFRGGRAGHH